MANLNLLEYSCNWSNSASLFGRSFTLAKMQWISWLKQKYNIKRGKLWAVEDLNIWSQQVSFKGRLTYGVFKVNLLSYAYSCFSLKSFNIYMLLKNIRANQKHHHNSPFNKSMPPNIQKVNINIQKATLTLR